MKHARVLLLFLLGAFLIYLSVQKIELRELLDYIRNGNYWIAIPVFVISMFGYLIRSLRWKLLLESMGNHPKTGHLYAALSMGYAVNFATPRFGEITRCLVLKKTDRIPIEQSLISVVIERAIDAICLLIAVGIAAVMNSGRSSEFVVSLILTPLFEKIKAMPWSVILIGGAVILGVFIWLYQRMAASSRVKQFVAQFLDSVKKVFALGQKIRFLVYTILIWACYFLMTFLWFYVFDETLVLGVKEAFLIMAVGSIGRSVPIQGGGMGAYHYLVSNAFALSGISLLTGNAMAFVIHGAQLLLTFALGSVAWIWLLYKFEQPSDEK
jgi:uncharacterized protein (TIRG00374 family)